MKKYYILQVLILSIFVSPAQERILSSGGQVSGTNGTINYSIGQTFDSVISGTNGTVSQGIQYGFEIFTLSNPELDDIKLALKSYPNPTLNNITLDITINSYEGVNYILHDINSKKIQNGKINQVKTIIPLQKKSSGVYILTVFQNSQELKTFKIIKK